MAELGRAQPAVAAVIGVLLTANMSLLYVDSVSTDTLAARRHARIAAKPDIRPEGLIVFGKTDSALGAPTVFAARADGSDLKPSSHPPRRTVGKPRDPLWSPDGRYIAFVWKGNIVVMSADRKTALVAYRAPVDGSEYLSLFAWTDDNMAT